MMHGGKNLLLQRLKTFSQYPNRKEMLIRNFNKTLDTRISDK